MSTAGLHLWRDDPIVSSAANLSRAKVIHTLKQASTNSDTNSVFNVSTWVTLLVLLVGELVLGGDQYIYLLRMMCTLRTNGIDGITTDTTQFLERQTDL